MVYSSLNNAHQCRKINRQSTPSHHFSSQALVEFDAISTTINAQNPTTTDVSSNFTEPPISSGPAAPSQGPTTGPQYPPTAPGITHQNIGLLEAVEYSSIVAYYVFFVFCICLHILLLNLLVGLAVDDISKIMDDSKGRRLRKQVGQSWVIEETVHFRLN